MATTTANGTLRRAWLLASAALVLAAAAVWSPHSSAQGSTDDPLTPAELEALVGPVALYPDEVLGVVLPAATYPLEVVQAARFLEDREANPGLEADPDWDDSVVALLNYPDVLRLMNDDLDWTWDLGEAVLDDQAAVLDAVQAFRDRAYDAGNLVSDDRQSVTESEGVIAITPADPEVVYIPYYEPTAVVVRQVRPVFHYYPYAYPLYYYPYPVGYRFSTGYFWGVTSAFAIGWNTHFIHVHHHTHFRHPYYRRAFYTPYYARRGINVTVNVNNYRNVWRPRRERGARPYDGIRAIRGDDRARRTYDGRRYRYSEGYVDAERARQRNSTGAGAARGTATLPRQGRAGSERSGTYRQGAITPGTTRRGSETIRQPRTGERNVTPNSGVRTGITRPGNIGGVASDRRAPSTERRAEPRTPASRGTDPRAYRGTQGRTTGGGAADRGVTNRSGLATGDVARQRNAGNAPGRGMQQRTVPPSARSQTRAVPPARNQGTRAVAPSARQAPSQSRVRAAPSARAPQARMSQPRAPQPRASAGGSRFGGVAPSTRAPRAAAPRSGDGQVRGGNARSQSGGQSRQR